MFVPTHIYESQRKRLNHSELCTVATVYEPPLWINGERRSASDGGSFAVHNYVTKQLVGTTANATWQDCEVCSASDVV